MGCLLAWFYAVTRISARCQRASITLPRATFHACATRKHFTRRSNDRRISCLRDSADISPPGAACPACPHPSPLGLYGLGCGSNNDSYAPTNRFWMHSCSPPLGCLLAWFYAVTRISARCQRASITLPRATFHACATRKHFTRRSNDRRISCLRDSADISPPGAACPACHRPWLILFRINEKQPIHSISHPK